MKKSWVNDLGDGLSNCRVCFLNNFLGIQDVIKAVSIGYITNQVTRERAETNVNDLKTIKVAKFSRGL